MHIQYIDTQIHLHMHVHTNTHTYMSTYIHHNNQHAVVSLTLNRTQPLQLLPNLHQDLVAYYLTYSPHRNKLCD